MSWGINPGPMTTDDIEMLAHSHSLSRGKEIAVTEFNLRLDHLLARLPEHLEAIEADPLLKHCESNGLRIYNCRKKLYTPLEEHQLLAKGIVLAGSPPRLVSLPYIKMYNPHERPEVMTLALDLWEDPDITVNFAEKLDGTMVQTFVHDGKVIITTRGMIEGGPKADADCFDYLGKSRAFFEANHPKVLNAMGHQGMTLLWEYIHPDSRVVTDYGGIESMTLTGAYLRDGTFVGSYADHLMVGGLGFVFGVPSVDCWELHGSTLQARMKSLADRIAGTDKEGCVISFEENGEVIHRVKCKGADYIRLMRLMAHCTYKATRAHLEANPQISTWAKFRAFLLDQGNDAVPEEILDTYKEHWVRYIKCTWVCSHIAEYVRGIGLEVDWKASSRKEYALWVKTLPQPLHALFFSVLSKKVDQTIHKLIGGDLEKAQELLDMVCEVKS